MSATAPLILVVDDDARSARLLARLLREDGFETEVAFDGAAAIERIHRAPTPDAIVTDYRMPHADGLALVSDVRARFPRLPVFIVTAYPELLRIGHDLAPIPRVFTKPLAYADLVSALPSAA